MLFDLNDYPLLAVFAVSMVVILAVSEGGRWLGVRAALKGADSVSTLESAILGLLALMIGFTFAMALSRFEARRDAVLAEANAIGTTALRARLLPAPHNGQTIKLLREYIQIRLDLSRRNATPENLADVLSRSNVLQEALWQQAKAVAAKAPGANATVLRADEINNQRRAAEPVMFPPQYPGARGSQASDAQWK